MKTTQNSTTGRRAVLGGVSAAGSAPRRQPFAG